MFSPAMLVSSGELSRQLALPRRSVVGISVMEYASFGQEVVRKSRLAPGTVAQIAVISHMEKPIPVSRFIWISRALRHIRLWPVPTVPENPI